MTRKIETTWAAAHYLTFDERARELVRDLHTVTPSYFWVDLFATAILAWTGFTLAIALHWLSPAMLCASVLAAMSFYRGLCFMHELTHIRQNALPGFDTAWNVLFGVPLLLPSFMYVGVHGDHHKLSTYGTEQDPEYLPFAKSHAKMMFFVLHSVLIPLFLLVRFFLAAPISFCVPRLRMPLAVHASALSINLAYRRNVTPCVLVAMRRWELIVMGVWTIALIAGFLGLLPVRAFVIWYGMMALTAVINSLRTLGAHEYHSDGEPMDRTHQLLDSVDTPGAFWTEIWAPVGLRYHALHHYFPGIPYHNLREAHRRLAAALPPEAPYQKTISRGLWRSLAELYRKGHTVQLQPETNGGNSSTTVKRASHTPQ